MLTSRSLDALGTLQADRGRLDLAEPLTREALEVYRIVFGDQHPQVALSLHSMAAKYFRAGLGGVAARLLAEAEPAVSAALNAERPHPQWAHVLLLRARVRLSEGNTGAAEPTGVPGSQGLRGAQPTTPDRPKTLYLREDRTLARIALSIEPGQPPDPNDSGQLPPHARHADQLGHTRNERHATGGG